MSLVRREYYIDISKNINAANVSSGSIQSVELQPYVFGDEIQIGLIFQDAGGTLSWNADATKLITLTLGDANNLYALQDYWIPSAGYGWIGSLNLNTSTLNDALLGKDYIEAILQITITDSLTSTIDTRLYQRIIIYNNISDSIVPITGSQYATLAQISQSFISINNLNNWTASSNSHRGTYRTLDNKIGFAYNGNYPVGGIPFATDSASITMSRNLITDGSTIYANLSGTSSWASNALVATYATSAMDADNAAGWQRINSLTYTTQSKIGIFTNNPAADIEIIKSGSKLDMVIGSEDITNIVYKSKDQPIILDFIESGAAVGRIYCESEKFWFQSEKDNVGYIAFYTTTGSNLVERARVSNRGYFGIATDQPSERLHVVGNILCSNITASNLRGTASFAISASYSPAGNLIDGATYRITASYAISSSVSATSINWNTASTYPITASWSLYAISASYRSASYSISASYANIGSGSNNYVPIWQNNRLSPTSSIYYITNYLMISSSISASNLTLINDPIGGRSVPSRVYIESRGQNLITNGSGLMENNYNFSQFRFDPTETHGGGGSFNCSRSMFHYSDEFIPVDTSKYYRLSLWAKSGNIITSQTGSIIQDYTGSSRHYAGIVCYDIDYNSISPLYYGIYPGSANAKLIADVNNGDTQVRINDSTGWYTGTVIYTRFFRWYNWTNSKGYVYPDYTYSRYYSGYDMWESGSASITSSISGSIIYLKAPWSYGFLPSGSSISNGQNSAGVYKYILMDNAIITSSWTKYSGIIGELSNNQSNYNKFPHGTAYIKFQIYPNYNSPTSSVRISDVYLSELSTYNLEAASSSIPGIITTGSQTFVGSKFVNNFYPSTTNTYALGDVSYKWNSAYINNIYGTSSWANNAKTASYIGSGSNNYVPIWQNNRLSPTSSIIVSGQNVGINTTSPTSNLQIGNTFQLHSYNGYVGALGFNRRIMTGAILDNSYGAFQIHSLSGSLYIQSYNSSGTQLTQHVFSSSNVGIKCTPIDTLTVEGNVVPSYTNMYNVGTLNNRWLNAYINSVQALSLVVSGSGYGYCQINQGTDVGRAGYYNIFNALGQRMFYLGYVTSSIWFNSDLGLPFVLSNGNVTSNANNTFDLGSSVLKWANVYATNFRGNLLGTASYASSASYTSVNVTSVSSASYASSSLSSSYSLQSLSSSYSLNTLLSINSNQSISSSYASSSFSSSYSLSSSYALNSNNTISSSYASTASYIGSGTNNYVPTWQNNTLSSTSSIIVSGNSIGIGVTNPIYTIDASGIVRASTNVIAGIPYTYGYCMLSSPGLATKSGFISFHKVDTTRIGYIGYETSSFQFYSDLGLPYVFGNGNVGIKCNPIDTLTVAGNAIPFITNTYNIGSADYRWLNAYINSVQALGISVSGSGGGYCLINQGPTTSKAGYYNIYNPLGQRMCYIGYETSSIYFSSDLGLHFQFGSTVKSTGDNVFDLGTDTFRWKNCYAVNFIGNFVGTASGSLLSISASFASSSLNSTNATRAVSASFASSSLNANNATQTISASFASSSINATNSTRAISASYASSSLSASYATLLGGQNINYFQPAIVYAGSYAISASWAYNSIDSTNSTNAVRTISASFASASISSSYVAAADSVDGYHFGSLTNNKLLKYYLATNQILSTNIEDDGNTITLAKPTTLSSGATGSLLGTASWANNSINSKQTISSSFASRSLNADNASWAANATYSISSNSATSASHADISDVATNANYASNAGQLSGNSLAYFQPALTNNQIYNITASKAISASYAPSSPSVSSSYALKASSADSVISAAFANNCDTLDGYHSSYFEPAITAGLANQYWSGNKTWTLLQLNQLYDVSVSTPAVGQALIYDGTYFRNSTNFTCSKAQGVLTAGDGIISFTYDISGNRTVAIDFPGTGGYNGTSTQAARADHSHQGLVATGSTMPCTSSWANNVIQAIRAVSSSYASSSFSSSYSVSSSYAVRCLSASYAPGTGGSGVSASYAGSSSWADIALEINAPYTMSSKSPTGEYFQVKFKDTSGNEYTRWLQAF